MQRPGAHCFVVAKKRGNSRGAKGAGHPRQDRVNGKPEELLVLTEGGSLPSGGTSRMNREVHVRIRGRLGAKSPGLPGEGKRDGALPSAPALVLDSTTVTVDPSYRTGMEALHVIARSHPARGVANPPGH